MCIRDSPDPEHLADDDHDKEDPKHRQERPDRDHRRFSYAESEDRYGAQRRRQGNDAADDLERERPHPDSHAVPHVDFSVPASPAMTSEAAGSSWSNARPAVTFNVGSSLVGSQACRATLRSRAATIEGSNWVPARSCSCASASATV